MFVMSIENLKNCVYFRKIDIKLEIFFMFTVSAVISMKKKLKKKNQEIRLQKIEKIRNYLLRKIKQNELMSNYYICFHCFCFFSWYSYENYKCCNRIKKFCNN